MYRVFHALKYAWKFLGTVNAENLEQALELAKAQYPDVSLKVLDQEGNVRGNDVQ